MGVLWALASAVCYGVADYTGGLLSRRAHFALVALLGQVGGLLLALAAIPLFAGGPPRSPDLVWGAVSGVGTGLGMIFLYRGMSRGAMSVVVPVSAVTGVALPGLVGLMLLGDRPSPLAWLGLTVTLPALWLVGRGGGPGPPGPGTSASVDGLIAGCGIALQYLALAQAAQTAIWPIAAGRLAAVLTLLPLAGRYPSRAHPVTPRCVAGALATGMTAALALVCYVLAVREELVVVAVALSSFYPAIPVLLGTTVLGERISRLQLAGLSAAALAIGLLAR